MNACLLKFILLRPRARGDSFMTPAVDPRFVTGAQSLQLECTGMYTYTF